MPGAPQQPAPQRPDWGPRAFRPEWRETGSAAFDLHHNSTARRLVEVPLWGEVRAIYANANLSVYSGQKCNAACAFCVEELRPISRGRRVLRGGLDDTDVYLARLDATLTALRPLRPSVAVTGGEPSLDPRLPAIMALLRQHQIRKKTLTTNATGLWLQRAGRAIVDHLIVAGLDHLNISRAHPDPQRNAELMNLRDGLSDGDLHRAITHAQAAGLPVRLSCVLLQEGVGELAQVRRYLRFAQDLGVRSVIFRQLMRPDPSTTRPVGVATYSARQRVAMAPLIAALTAATETRFVRQVMGYYYYVEVWQVRLGAQWMTVTFEAADLRQLEVEKRKHPGRVHELIFHPDGQLCSTWQRWDGRLGPPESVGRG